MYEEFLNRERERERPISRSTFSLMIAFALDRDLGAWERLTQLLYK